MDKQKCFDIYFDKIESTQTYLRENWQIIYKEHKISEGQWIRVRAGEQTKGRGQGNNIWISPSNRNLYATYLINWPIQFIDKIKYFPQIAIYCVYQSLAQLLQLSEENQQFKIKWINDLYLNNKKICGVLSESELEGEDLRIFLGIGVNVHPTHNTEFSSIQQELNIDLDLDQLNNIIFEKLFHNINGLKCNQDYFKTNIKQQIMQRLYLKTKYIRLWDMNKETILAQGQLDGIDDEGQLLIRLQSGLIATYNSGRLEQINPDQ